MPQKIPSPFDEDRHLEALRQFHVLETEPKPVFDALARQVAKVCATPIALLTLIDAHRQWFKASFGLPGTLQTPREAAFRAYTITQDSLIELDDASLDPRFAANPWVTRGARDPVLRRHPADAGSRRAGRHAVRLRPSPS